MDLVSSWFVCWKVLGSSEQHCRGFPFPSGIKQNSSLIKLAFPEFHLISDQLARNKDTVIVFLVSDGQKYI
jgi:hypothetical protein